VVVAPTPRAIVAAFSATLLYILGFLGVYPLITLPLSLFLLVALVADYAAATRYESILSRISVRRDAEERAAPENTPIRVTTRICNKSSETINNLVVREDTPPRTRREPAATGFLVDAAPKTCTSYTYSLIGAPGLSTARTIVLEKPSLLALFQATRVLESILVVRYYPIALSTRTRIRAGEVLGLEEIYSRRIKGAGIEFYSLREYQPGDDPRRIVWPATARLGKLVVREDLAELRLRLYIFLDLSKPMWIGRPGDTPGDHALRLASTLAMGVKRGAGILGYTFLHGEIWFSRYPGHASEVFLELYNRASMTDPYLSSPRTNFRDALREASTFSENMPLIVLTGPEISLHVDDVLDVAKRRRAPVIIVYLRPRLNEDVFIKEYEFLRDRARGAPLVHVLTASSLADALSLLNMVAPRLARYAA